MPPLNASPLPVQRASEGALGGLRRLVRDLRLDAHLHGDLILTGRDPLSARRTASARPQRRRSCSSAADGAHVVDLDVPGEPGGVGNFGEEQEVHGGPGCGGAVGFAPGAEQFA